MKFMTSRETQELRVEEAITFVKAVFHHGRNFARGAEFFFVCELFARKKDNEKFCSARKIPSSGKRFL